MYQELYNIHRKTALLKSYRKEKKQSLNEFSRSDFKGKEFISKSPALVFSHLAENVMLGKRKNTTVMIHFTNDGESGTQTLNFSKPDGKTLILARFGYKLDPKTLYWRLFYSL